MRAVGGNKSDVNRRETTNRGSRVFFITASGKNLRQWRARRMAARYKTAPVRRSQERQLDLQGQFRLDGKRVIHETTRNSTKKWHEFRGLCSCRFVWFRG